MNKILGVIAGLVMLVWMGQIIVNGSEINETWIFSTETAGPIRPYLDEDEVHPMARHFIGLGAHVATGGAALNIRSAPNANGAIIGSRDAGYRIDTPMHWQSRPTSLTGWIQVRIGIGHSTGYMSRQFLAFDGDPATHAYWRVNTPGTTLNVRSGAGTSHNVVRSLSHNATVNILGTNGRWGRIGTNEWIHMDHIRR